MNIMDIINIIAVIISPIVAVLITVYINKLQVERNEKLWIFKVLLIKQYSALDNSRNEALNLIPIVFFKCNKVIEQYEKYKNIHNEITENLEKSSFNDITAKDCNKINESYTKLLESISINLGYSKKIKWDNLRKIIIPHSYFHDDKEYWY